MILAAQGEQTCRRTACRYTLRLSEWHCSSNLVKGGVWHSCG